MAGEPSFELFEQERGSIFEGLQRRALRLTDALNEVPGISCQPIDGAEIELFEPSVRGKREILRAVGDGVH